MNQKILVYGAGAIGRGYLPWLFPSDRYDISFVEINERLRNLLRKQKQFTTFQTKTDQYESLVIQFDECFDLGEEDPTCYDGIITAVGPRQVYSLIESFSNVECPIVLFENDANLSKELKDITGKDNIYFGVPDVITSNTASADMLSEDPLSIITEDGVCFVHDGASALGGNISYVDQDELDKQWITKLYIHNTPHCIAAYLGAMKGHMYLHEGMKNDAIYAIVEGAMTEMSTAIITLFDIDRDFVEWYSKKELARFSNSLLLDPISRVAREPFRKLGLNDRLMGAAQLALSSGVMPNNLILGIISAFLYDQENDEDFHIKILVNALERDKFLELIINMNPHEALYKIIIRQWSETLEILAGIPNE